MRVRAGRRLRVISVVRAAPADVPAWRALAPLAGEVDDLAWLVRLDEAIEEGRAWGAVDLVGQLVGGMLVHDAPSAFRLVWIAGSGDAQEALRSHARLLAGLRQVEERP